MRIAQIKISITEKIRSIRFIRVYSRLQLNKG